MPTAVALPELSVPHRRFVSSWWLSAWVDLQRCRRLGYRRCAADAANDVRVACQEQRAWGQLRRACRRLGLPIVYGDEAFYVHARGRWYLCLFFPRQRPDHGPAFWMRYDVDTLDHGCWSDEFTGRGMVDSPHGRDVAEAFAADSWLTADGTCQRLPLHRVDEPTGTPTES